MCILLIKLNFRHVHKPNSGIVSSLTITNFCFFVTSLKVHNSSTIPSGFILLPPKLSKIILVDSNSIFDFLTLLYIFNGKTFTSAPVSNLNLTVLLFI